MNTGRKSVLDTPYRRQFTRRGLQQLQDDFIAEFNNSDDVDMETAEATTAVLAEPANESAIAAANAAIEGNKEQGENGPEIYAENISLAKLRVKAIKYMKLFFSTKQLHCGGPISDRILLSKRNMFLVLHCSLEFVVPHIYQAMAINGCVSECDDDDDEARRGDVEWVVAFLDRCGIERVPPKFIGGLMVMYMELCEGIEIESIDIPDGNDDST